MKHLKAMAKIVEECGYYLPVCPWLTIDIMSEEALILDGKGKIVRVVSLSRTPSDRRRK